MTLIKPKSRRFKPKTRKLGFNRKKRAGSKRAVKTSKYRQDVVIRTNKNGEIVSRSIVRSKKLLNKNRRKRS